MSGLSDREGAVRVGAIDIGTNSVLLLIAEARGDEVVALLELATITRLGQGVDRTRALDGAAVERTLACLGTYAAELAARGVTLLDVVGTSAMRDAAGGEAFRERAATLLGVLPRVISGDEEARLSFEGALVGLPAASTGDEGDTLVFDIGGGSTELVIGRGASVRAAHSLDVGSVRLTERHVATDPPSDAELQAVREDVRAALATLPVDVAAARGAGTRLNLVGVAGTVTSLAALARDVDPYDADRVHGARLSVEELHALTRRLAGMTTAARKDLPGLSPQRADVIVAGAVLCEEVVAWAGAEALTVSDRGVRWGVARRLAARALAPGGPAVDGSGGRPHRPGT